MNNLITIFAGVLVLFSRDSLCSITVQQIKTTDTQLWFVNRTYLGAVKYHIAKHNETYNNIQLHCVVIEDLPKDIIVDTKVYKIDKCGNNSQLIWTDKIPICEKTNLKSYLPAVMQVDESDYGKKCIKKGAINVVDMGQLRFEYLIPNIHLNGPFYRVDYTVETPNIKILEASAYCQWGHYEL